MRKRLLISYILFTIFLLSCSVHYDTPQEKINAYMNAMIEGDTKKASEIINVDLKEEQSNEIEQLESDLMKYSYSKAKYKVLKVEELDDKTNISIEIENFHFLNTLDEVKNESIKKNFNDEETIALFKKNSVDAKTIKQQVMVSFIKEKDDWVFSGSSNLMELALLGFPIS